GLNEISKITKLNKATLHEHLSKLNEVGLVKRKEREGRATSGPGRFPQPFDYEITFGPTSTSIVTGIELPFTVVNLTRANEQIEVFTPDINANGVWDLGEQVIFVEMINDRQTATWEVRFEDEGGFPADGDVFFLRTDKPFTDADAFTFGTVAATVDSGQAREQLRDIYVVPNPYVATNELEPRNPFARDERGDRRLYFANLPQECTIRIYTIAGELVDTVEHSSSLDNGKAFWDLRTKDNMNIAYGLYIFHVDSNEGSFIGKFAVIK
ncbi:MAG: helix-turn-helix domain-containing protein, partial [Rhodothermales bacterium]|nr:helix-turn-helix domain-containing protein [Rhodothermales bacterium]